MKKIVFLSFFFVLIGIIIFGVANINFIQAATPKINTRIFSEIDNDGDGLTDKEETLIYITNPKKIDTNKNNYADGLEVENGYDPAGKRGKLPAFSTAENTLISLEKYISECDVNSYFDRIFFPPTKVMNQIIQNSRIFKNFAEFRNTYKQNLLNKVSGNKIKNIKYIDKKVIDANNIYFKYAVNYSDAKGQTYSSTNREIYLIKTFKGWMINYKKQLDVELEEARTASRDAKRISDIKQIQTALELYYNDNDKYPDTIYASIGCKTESCFIDNKYNIGSMVCMENPFPDAKIISEKQNCIMTTTPMNPKIRVDLKDSQYKYSVAKDKKNYSLTFFLENKSGGLSAGENTATYAGIKSKKLDKKYEPDNDIVKKCEEVVNKIKADENKLKEEKNKEEEAVNPGITLDKKRIGDIRQIQTALELYFNDQNKYPVEVNVGGSIKFGNVTYMSAVPKNQTPVNSNCQDTPEFLYAQKQNGASYELIFCLGNGYSNYKKGVSIASPAGIESK